MQQQTQEFLHQIPKKERLKILKLYFNFLTLEIIQAKFNQLKID